MDRQIIEILLHAGGTMTSAEFQALPEELVEALAVRPDILDAPKMQICEIKPVGSLALAESEALYYIEVLEELGKRAGIKDFVFSLGSMTNRGVEGVLPTEDGRWCVHFCPAPGVILQMVDQTENPEHLKERAKNEAAGVSDTMVGVESVTAAAILGGEGLQWLSTAGFPAIEAYLGRLLVNARKLAAAR